MEYGQFCPISKASEVLGEKWTLLIIRELLLGTTRFNDFQRGMSKISPTVLTKRLNSLVEHGLVVRKRIPNQRGYEYQLTQAGKELYPLVEHLAIWGMRWARGQMADSELDVELLMWDIRRRIDTEKLPGGETVLEFEFTDLQVFRHWWIVAGERDVDLCTEDPGKDVDVYVETDQRTLTEVWMGDVPIEEARSNGAVAVDGPPALVRNMPAWFLLSEVAGVRPADS